MSTYREISEFQARAAEIFARHQALKALAHRAVACRHWRWMPGMACDWKEPDGCQRVLSVDLESRSYVVDGFGVEHEWAGARLPNLDDPATLGCLLALVREVWGSRFHLILNDDTRTPDWIVCGARLRNGQPVIMKNSFATEAAALVAALEAAP
jgi:hypothetical protein